MLYWKSGFTSSCKFIHFLIVVCYWFLPQISTQNLKMKRLRGDDIKVLIIWSNLDYIFPLFWNFIRSYISCLLIFIQAQHWDSFYSFYRNTTDNKSVPSTVVRWKYCNELTCVLIFTLFMGLTGGAGHFWQGTSSTTWVRRWATK